MARQKPDNKEALRELQDTERQIAVLKRQAFVAQARRSLIPFTQATMPDHENPDDPYASRYHPQFFHRALANALESVVAGDIRRLLVTFPPRHGKSELCTRRLVPWFIGQNPYRQMIVGTYNQDFANSWGHSVKQTFESPSFRQIFPGCILDKKNVAELVTTENGKIAFVGRGGSATGKGADGIVIDDPIKDRQEAKSKVIRDEAWEWMKHTIETRLMSDIGWIILIMTRWHEDDPAGRILDPNNPYYHPKEAAKWTKFEIRALAEADDVLKRPIGQALWPERYGEEYLNHIKETQPEVFYPLYQQRPSPEDGDYFTRDMVVTYDRGELPDLSRMRIYAASDHAFGEKQKNDYTVIIVAGVDDEGRIWILDVWWQKKTTDIVVEQMLDIMAMHEPLIWWTGKDHITGAIGPFLRKRRIERGVWGTNVIELTDRKDKVAKAQAIIGRMRMGMVMFPKYAPWLSDAVDQLLKFDNATHDDFVDALANLGRGLDIQGGKAPKKEKYTPRTGTLDWIKEQTRRKERQARVRTFAGGM